MSGGEYIFDIILPVGCKNLSTEYEKAIVKIDTNPAEQSYLAKCQ